MALDAETWKSILAMVRAADTRSPVRRRSQAMTLRKNPRLWGDLLQRMGMQHLLGKILHGNAPKRWIVAARTAIAADAVTLRKAELSLKDPEAQRADDLLVVETVVRTAEDADRYRDIHQIQVKIGEIHRAPNDTGPA